MTATPPAGEVIWKFPVPPYDYRTQGVTTRPTVQMPMGARVLTLQLQDGEPTLWAIVDPRQVTETRAFVIVGTGQPVPDNAGPYVGTWQWPPMVFHLFEAV